MVDVKEDSSDEDLIALLELTKPPKNKPPKSNAKDDSTSSNTPDNDTFDVILPPLLGSGNAGECTVMIEVDPEDAALLDYEGISGAIGRFEADDRGGTLRSLALLVVFFACSFNPLAHGLVVVVLLILVVLDLKGCQYQGSLLPGPTALIVSLSKGGQLRVEGITDEFATLVKTQDVMAKLDGVVEGEMDDGFRVRDENVNRSTKHQDATDA